MSGRERLYSFTILTVALTCPTTVKADPSRVEIINFENKAALGTHELDFLQ